MNKQQAAEKLINLFGDMNIIGVLHSILVETSKYIIIILFAIYTWHCFTVFIGRNKEREQRVYARQQKNDICKYIYSNICIVLKQS